MHESDLNLINSIRKVASGTSGFDEGANAVLDIVQHRTNSRVLRYYKLKDSLIKY